MADLAKITRGAGHVSTAPGRRAAGWSLWMLFLMLFGGPGCLTSPTAANRIVEAPNIHDSFGVNRATKQLWEHLETNFVVPGTSHPIISLTVPVGPPPAVLKAVELPPQDYHLDISDKVVPVANGKHNLDFWMMPQTNAPPRPEPPDRHATIFVLHGYLLNKETMAGWAFFLAQAGYRVVLVDLRGHGQSTGDTVSFGQHETEDFRQLLDYLQAHGLCDDTVGVIGYSYGADLALHWAAHDSRVRAVVAIAPYNHPEDAIERLVRELGIHISHRTVEKALVLASERMNIQWADWSGEAAIRQVHVPVLLVGGGKDATSRPDDIATLHAAAAGESTVIEIPMADHSSIEFWFHELGEPVLTWFQEKLGR
jgi:pimeloyl-ACP methyl ester carboxylesterase